MIERMHHVLQTVHVVSVDVPISKAAVRFVLNVSNILWHYGTGDVDIVFDAFLQHGDLKFAQYLKGKRRGNVY